MQNMTNQVVFECVYRHMLNDVTVVASDFRQARLVNRECDKLFRASVKQVVISCYPDVQPWDSDTCLRAVWSMMPRHPNIELCHLRIQPSSDQIHIGTKVR